MLPRLPIRPRRRHRARQILVGGLLLGGWVAAHAVELAISCGAVGIELQLCRASADAWSRQTGHQVQVVSTPNSATERLALYQQLLAGRSSEIDVYQIDVVWPGLLAKHLIDLQPYSGGAQAAHFAAVIDNNTVAGRLVAMPLYLDVGLLYYRQDLLAHHHLPVPTTWAQLRDTAARVQAAERAAGHTKMWGFVFQGKTYEGLTCNALEWFSSYGGGQFVDAQGRVSVDNPRALQALRMARSWVGTIAPTGVLNYAEEEARGVFQSGHAVFMRNWPYAWALMNNPDSPVGGRVGVAPLPAGSAHDRAGSTLGGWQLAVSRYSRHPAEAASLVMYMSSAAEQRRRAVQGGYNPTLPALYDDPAILQAQPFIGALRGVVAQAVARPSRVTRSRYNRVSDAVANQVHEALSGRQTPEQALAALADELRRVSRRGWR